MKSTHDLPAPQRVGLVGAGPQMINHLLPALLGVAGAEVVAIAETDESRRKMSARRFGIPYEFDGLAHMLDSVRLDAVVAACPPKAHEEILAACIAQGVPVSSRNRPSPR